MKRAAAPRMQKDGSAKKSALLTDLEELLALDTGSWSSGLLVCNCWDPARNKPRHRNISECRDHFTMLYYRVFLGSSWPLPSVTKFTNMSIIDRRVRLGLATHNIMRVLVEPFVFEHSEDISIYSVGAGMSDYQVVHRGRKSNVWQWISSPDCLWKVNVMGTITAVLDKLTYSWIGAGQEPAFVHDVICDGGIVGVAQQSLLQLLETWVDDSSEAWAVLDHAVAPLKRSEAGEDLTRYMRRNVIKYAAGMLRRYELPLTHVEKPLHVATCTSCSPLAADRDAALADLERRRSCCVTGFARKVAALRTEQKSTLAERAIALRERLKSFSTKKSESAHAHSQSRLRRSGKPLSLSTFARKVFMTKFVGAHKLHGGDASWHTNADALLLRAENEGLRRERDPTNLDARVLGDVGGDGSGGPSDADAVALPSAAEGAVAARPPRTPGGLNPVLWHFNTKQEVAKSLGVVVDQAFKDKALAEVQAAYRDPVLKPGMVRKYNEYLESHGEKQSHAPDGAVLPSTFWGWGTRCLPLPVREVRKHVLDHGLVPKAAACDQVANDEFRVTAAEAEQFVPRAITRCYGACGASPHNECRSFRGDQPGGPTHARARGPPMFGVAVRASTPARAARFPRPGRAENAAMGAPTRRKAGRSKSPQGPSEAHAQQARPERIRAFALRICVWLWHETGAIARISLT